MRSPIKGHICYLNLFSCSGHDLSGMPSFQRQCGGRSALMRINIWIILGTLLALLAITRYMQYQRDTQRICANDPTASVCER
jgi:hypothetical protein